MGGGGSWSSVLLRTSGEHSVRSSDMSKLSGYSLTKNCRNRLVIDRSVGFGIPDKRLCSIDGCAAPPWKWGCSAVQAGAGSRTSSVPRNSPSERSCHTFFNGWGVFFSVSEERLQGLPKPSTDGKRRSSTLLVPRSPLGLSWRWVPTILPSVALVPPPANCFGAEDRFCDSFWLTCPLIVRPEHGLPTGVVRRSWCKTCQWRPVQNKVVRKFCNKRTVEIAACSKGGVQDGLCVLTD